MPTIQFRRGTASEWQRVNPTLASGEPGYETDTGGHKIGDGRTSWDLLPYVNGGGEMPGAITKISVVTQEVYDASEPMSQVLYLIKD